MLHKLKKYILFPICMVLAVIWVSKSADASQSTALDEAKKGIVRLCVGYTKNDEAGAKFYSINQTCGCLVSNFDNSVYIIAPYHDMNISEKKKKKFLKKKKLKKEDVTLVRKVFISGDMKSDVEIVTTSEQNDFCLLSVDDVIKEKVSLRFKKVDAIEKSEKISAIGYSASSQKKGHFDENDVEFTEGKVIEKSKSKDGVQCIEHTAEISDRNSGGALVDENGYFVGMNNKKYNKKKTYYSLKTDKIKELLDNRGILYYSEENDIAISKLKKELKRCIGIVGKSEYKTESKEVLNQAIEKANESLNSEENITSATAKSLESDLIKGRKQLIKKKSKLIILQIVFGVVDIIFIIWVVSNIVKNINSTKELEGLKESETDNPKHEKNIVQDDNKTGADMENKNKMHKNGIDEIDATVKMIEYAGQKNTFENRRQIAYLRRNADNSYAAIDREKFIIGKNADVVNYCIANNKTISRVHAGIWWVDEQYLLYDMGSANGTYVNNVKLIDKPVKLNNGDIILLSNEYFQFLTAENN